MCFVASAAVDAAPPDREHFMSPTDELWGTFAVDDHLRLRAFVAEVLLFDRLVIPRPHKEDEEQYREWCDAGWQPKRLVEIIDRLGNLAIPITWDKNVRSTWQNQYGALSPAERALMRASMAQGSTFDFGTIRNAKDTPAKWLTRMVLVDKIKEFTGDSSDDLVDEAFLQSIKKLDIDPAADIEAIVGYGSYAKFSAEVQIDVAPTPTVLAADTALLFRWDFVVPEDSTLSDDTLLDRAIKLSHHDEFRQSRRELHDWRRKLVAKNISVDRARTEMNRCIEVYNGIAEKALLSNHRRTALQVAAVTAPIADLLMPGAGSIAGVVLGVVALFANQLLPAPKVGPREKFAALVHDSREAFG